MNDKTVTEFFSSEYPSFGAYDNVRKIASYVDGLKLSQRKVIYTMLKKFQNPATENKTSRLASSVAEQTEYLHGEGSLCVVLNSLAAAFVGSNNYPLITGHGNFGTRFAGSGSAAAPRYTYCSIAPLTLELFNEDDNVLCKSQVFEGSEIEPKFFMPIFPVLFLNGTDGLSSGWKTQIYPRNSADIIKYFKDTLHNKKTADPDTFAPYFKGFKGVTKLESVTRPDGAVEKVFVNYGVIDKISSTELHISEIPITYNYGGYINVLDRLVDKGLILDYDDKSDPKSDTFEFTIKVRRTFFDDYKTQQDWIKVFSLSKTLSEQLNSIDTNNKVKEFASVKEILDAFATIRLEFYKLRKQHLIDKYTNQLQLDASKYIWCKGVIDDTIHIKNKPKADIIKQLEKTENIIKKDGSFNYLLNMPMHSISKETLDALKADIKQLKDKLADIKSMQIADMWIADLDSFGAKL